MTKTHKTPIFTPPVPHAPLGSPFKPPSELRTLQFQGILAMTHRLNLTMSRESMKNDLEREVNLIKREGSRWTSSPNQIREEEKGSPPGAFSSPTSKMSLHQAQERINTSLEKTPQRTNRGFAGTDRARR